MLVCHKTGVVSDIDSELTAMTRAAMPLVETLGIDMVVAGRDQVRARLAWSESLCTSGGILHGGALMALADSVGGLCAFHNLPPGSVGTSTITSNTNFLRAVRSGSVEAVCEPLHVGRTTIVVTTHIWDDDARLVARVSQTQAVLVATG